MSKFFFFFCFSHKSDWEEKKLPGSTLNSFTFSNLLCGSYYQFYMIAYNSIDKSEPSKVIAARTKGTGNLDFKFFCNYVIIFIIK